MLFPLFTAPSFRTFCGLACGFLTQTGKRTVCGMLTGAGLAQVWPHDRAHWFFSRARWNPDERPAPGCSLPGRPAPEAATNVRIERLVWSGLEL